MATSTVRVDGLRELGERMRALAAEVSLKASRRATAAGAQVIKKQAVRNIETSPSIVTGSLHDAVIVKRIPNAQTVLTSEHIVTVRGKNRGGKSSKSKRAIAPHAHFVEFGTVKMPAEPFLRPAYETRKEEAVTAMVAELAKSITKAGG